MASMLANTLQEPRCKTANARHPYANVLHELVYALLGISGDVFVCRRPLTDALAVVSPAKSWFHVTPDATWISDVDKAELGDILVLGFHYAEIERFVNTCLRPLDFDKVHAPYQGLAMGLEGALPCLLGQHT
jgi:hypothetical protein